MRREAIRHMLWRSRGDGPSRRLRLPAGNRISSSSRMSASWQHSLPFYHEPGCETFQQLQSPNVAINLNLQLGGMSEINNLMVTPPPYTEVEENPPVNNQPPPPYSTLDRRACSDNQRVLNGDCSHEERTPNVPSVLPRGIACANDENSSSARRESEESQRLLQTHSGSNGATPQIRPRLTGCEYSQSLLMSPSVCQSSDEANSTAAINEESVWKVLLLYNCLLYKSIDIIINYSDKFIVRYYYSLIRSVTS